MNEANLRLAEGLVSANYIKQAGESLRSRENLVKVLLSQRRCPEDGWDDASIEHFIHEIAIMDSNNFVGNVGVGEREARIASSIVARRHFGMGHGIGRSGNISEVQPKAAGSSLVVRLTEYMVMDMLRLTGVRSAEACVLLPVATGMSIVLTLLALRKTRPDAKYVVWSRIDQKSCFKAILAAGLVPLSVSCVLEGDELRTDIRGIEAAIEAAGGPSLVACIITTTSCFAPRAPDKVVEVGEICGARDIPHIVNNAYGVQSSKCMHLIETALRSMRDHHRGGPSGALNSNPHSPHETSPAKWSRVDAFVQSTDKNFLVPVGGAIVAGMKQLVDAVAKTYPGRASGSPIMDVFITLLHLGSNGYKSLLADRKRLHTYFVEKMDAVAKKHGERMLSTPHNPISFAMTLSSIGEDATMFGSMLFSRCVSGTRVVDPRKSEITIEGHTFRGFGAHYDAYPTPYLTAAAALGITQTDIDTFIDRLDRTLAKTKDAHRPPQNISSDMPPAQ
eukprot:Opistho-2@29300